MISPLCSAVSSPFLLRGKGGSFKYGLSLISSNLTSNFLQFQGQLDDDDGNGDEDEDEDEDAVGITEEVVDFVRKLSTRPELWIDFPHFSRGLREEDLKLLSAPQVVDARETLLKKLQNKSNTMQETSESHSRNPETNHDIDKQRILEGDVSDMQHKSTSSEIVTANKPMDNMAPEHNISKEEKSVDARKQSENEDISFSDL